MYSLEYARRPLRWTGSEHSNNPGFRLRPRLSRRCEYDIVHDRDLNVYQQKVFVGKEGSTFMDVFEQILEQVGGVGDFEIKMTLKFA
jgi:hypothetical protein